MTAIEVINYISHKEGILWEKALLHNRLPGS